MVWVLKEEVVGNRESFSLSSPEIFSDIEPGAYLLIDDGKIRLDVLENDGGKDEMPGEKFRLPSKQEGRQHSQCPALDPFLSQRDDDDIRFAAQNGVDLMSRLLL